MCSLCNYLESFLHEDKGFKGADADKRKILDDVFAWSYAWSLGGSLDQSGKDKFDYQVKDQFKAVKFPPSYTCYDYYYDLKREKVFKPWTSKVVPFVYDKDASYFDLMVPTTDTTKYSYSLE